MIVPVTILSPLQMTYYLFFSTPAPVPTVLVFYVLKPLYNMFGPRFNATSFALRERLGGGNFGITYEAVLKRGVLQPCVRPVHECFEAVDSTTRALVDACLICRSLRGSF